MLLLTTAVRRYGLRLFAKRMDQSAFLSASQFSTKKDYNITKKLLAVPFPLPCKTCSCHFHSRKSRILKSNPGRKIFKPRDRGNSDEDTNKEIHPTKMTPTKAKVSKPPPSLVKEFVQFGEHKTLIQDVIDEQWDPTAQPEYSTSDLDEHINFERGKTGVFDLEELVQLLYEEHASDICVISIADEMKYVDFLVLVTARSPKHLVAIATFIRRTFKRKNLKSSDVIPLLEGGKKTEDWMALDLGNIALHIFMHDKRVKVDLETLWTVGPQYDDISNEKDPEILKLFGTFLTSALDTKKVMQDKKI